ncbi:MAG: CocE/NonD family hydrolase [Catenulispora sp.]|nr:CocE/NonD family hydrolase [Catenulispora sp.]
MKLPRRTRFVRRRMHGLPAPKFDVGYEPGVRIPMPDGVELSADHYFPDPARSRAFPTLLVRSPYGRGLPWAALYGLIFAEQGFQVLLQSSRGTGGSQGIVQPWRDDGPDGLATVAWLRGQPWFDGRLGLLGPSAMAYSAWAVAADPPPEVKAMVVHVPLHSPHEFFYRGGAFALEDALIASTAFATRHLGPRKFLSAALRLARGMKRIVRAQEPVQEFARVMGRHVQVLETAAAHPDPSDGIWQGTNLLAAADGFTVPTLVVSGWSDVALDQALRQYSRLPAGSRSLLIGPWTHTSALQQDAGRVFGETVAWLQGRLGDSTPPKGRVQISVGPENAWRELPGWPPAALPVAWYTDEHGTLRDGAPDSAAPVGSLHYDPDDPTPSVGGAGLGRSAGVRDNGTLERRPDVLVFSSAALTETVEVIGTVAADLTVRVSGIADASEGEADSDRDTTKIFVRLCDVDDRGHSYNVCDGIAKIPATALIGAGQEVRVTVAMSATAHRFRPGHRIRVQISAGAHPRFAAGRHAHSIEIQAGSAVVLPVV